MSRYKICSRNVVIRSCIFALFILSALYSLKYHTSYGSSLVTQNSREYLLSETAEKPIVGWEPHVSRDMRRYVLPDQTTALIPQPGLCGQQLFLLVVVCSALNHFQYRAAIRDTWGASTRSVRVAFFLGNPNDATLQERISEESAKHGDVIQEDFLDSYNNLTIKSVMMFKWVRAYCPMARYIMKTDDDVLVYVGRLIRLLKQHKKEQKLLLGLLSTKMKPFRDTKYKWYCPRYMFGGSVYPDYLTGAGYVMSADVLHRLYEVVFSIPFFHLDDVYLTGICALHAGIHPRSRPHFVILQHHRQRAVVFHYVGPETMLSMWNRMLHKYH